MNKYYAVVTFDGSHKKNYLYVNDKVEQTFTSQIDNVKFERYMRLIIVAIYKMNGVGAISLKIDEPQYQSQVMTFNDKFTYTHDAVFGDKKDIKHFVMKLVKVKKHC